MGTNVWPYLIFGAILMAIAVAMFLPEFLQHRRRKKNMSNGCVTIGPECFSTLDRKVICWRGVNYYKACDVLVEEHKDGSTSHCVKRVGHPSNTHEDYDGRVFIEFTVDQTEDSQEEDR